MTTYTPSYDASDLTAVNDVLKEVYPSDTLETLFIEDMTILDMFEETTEYTDSNGDKAVLFLNLERAGAVSARKVGEALRKPDHRKRTRLEYEYTNHYVQVGVNGPVVARMKSNRTSAVREIDSEIKGALEDQRRDWVRQLWSDGDAVVCGSLPGNSSDTVIPLGTTDPRGLWAVERGFLYPGLAVDIGTASSPQARTGGNEIVDVDTTSSAPTITLANATAVTANDRIVIMGNRGTSADPTSRELSGFGEMFGTGTYGGVDPTTAGKGRWKAVVHSNSGTARANSISLMTNLLRVLRSNGKYPDFLMGDLYQEENYYQLLQGHVRYAGETNLTAGNTEGLAFAKIKSGFKGDPDAIPGRIWMGNTDIIKRFSAGPVAWQNTTEGGSILHWLPDYDQFQARAAKYWQVGLHGKRNCLGLLKDLSS